MTQLFSGDLFTAVRTVKPAARLPAQCANKTRAKDTGWQCKKADAQQRDDRAKKFAERRNRVNIAVTNRS